MKFIRLSIILSFIALLIQVPAVSQDEDCENLIWVDEFETDGAPDASKWGYDTGGGGWGNVELQTYTNNRTNSWVENGRLYIKAVKTNNSWSSARLITKDKGDWLYGRIEVKAKLPSGKGTWPAIWMLPTDWAYGDWPKSGEIDIMEHVGYDPGVVHGTVHTEAFNHSIGTQVGKSVQVPDAMSSFHVYAIEWSPESIKWYLDDQLYFTFNNQNKTYKEWPFDKRFHLLLNIAIGGNWGGAQGIDPNLTEVIMEVDYVRVYNNKLPKPVIQGSSLNEQNEELEYQIAPVFDANYIWQVPEGVSVLAGEGTNKITLQWNNAPGDLQVEVNTVCDTVLSDVFHVGYRFKPDGDQLTVLPVNNDQEMLWQQTPGDNNSFTLSEASGTLVVDFQITDPAQYPFVYYDFDGSVDLSDHNELALELKVDPASRPSNIRFDLVDVNGNVRLSNLFELEEFETDDAFHLYAHQFTPASSGTFLLDQIARIRIYVNYGVKGQAGSGSFQIRNLIMQAPSNTAVKDLAQQSSLTVYPNPATDFVTISSDEMIYDIQLFSIQGSLMLSKSSIRNKEYRLSFGAMQPGIYLIKVNQSQTALVSVR